MAGLKKDVVIIILLLVILALVWFRRTSGADVMVEAKAGGPGGAEIIVNNWRFLGRPNMDTPGNDIREMDGNSMDCAKACSTDAACVGVVMTKEGNHCWLKSNFSDKGPSDKTVWVKEKPVSVWPWRKKRATRCETHDGITRCQTFVNGVVVKQTETAKTGVMAGQAEGLQKTGVMAGQATELQKVGLANHIYGQIGNVETKQGVMA